MTQTHPLTPPEELLEHWDIVSKLGNWQNALTLAYRAGADQELKACCEWLAKYRKPILGEDLKYVRRPKPPSLAKRALHILGTHGDLSCAEHAAICAALEPLDD
jgi:hypothetical protein